MTQCMTSPSDKVMWANRMVVRRSPFLRLSGALTFVVSLGGGIRQCAWFDILLLIFGGRSLIAT